MRPLLKRYARILVGFDPQTLGVHHIHLPATEQSHSQAEVIVLEMNLAQPSDDRFRHIRKTNHPKIGTQIAHWRGLVAQAFVNADLFAAPLGHQCAGPHC